MIATRKSAAIAGALAVAFSGAIYASGSEGFTQGPNNEARLYNVGKGVYADKFACTGCPLAGKSLDANLAKQVLQGNPKVTLSTAEQDAVMVYLKRRFKI